MSDIMSLEKTINLTELSEWEWYTDVPTKTLYLHCLLMANNKSTTFQGIKLDKNSFITSLNKLSCETGLSVSQVRTAIKHLEISGYVETKTSNSFTIIKITKSHQY